MAYATGGTVTYWGPYRIHTFTSSGTLTVISGGEFECLVVGGGGGGGARIAGGGGAGGVVIGSTILSPGSQSVVVGAGGARSESQNVQGSDGESSSFAAFVANGGGGGASNETTSGRPGGSGGGSSRGGTPGAGTQGNAGGGSVGSGDFGAGGGGGFGGVGGTGTGSAAGNGGGGFDSGVFRKLDAVAMIAGGGGGGRQYNSAGSGSAGGGAGSNSTSPAGNATANTGSGGGGGGHSGSVGGDGGSGLVVVRYLATDEEAVYDNIILDDGPIIYLPLNDPSGTTATALVGLDGTYHGSPTLGANGPGVGGLDEAVEYTGSNYATVDFAASPLNLNAGVSAECWFMAPNAADADMIIVMDDSGTADGNANRRFQVRFDGTAGKIRVISLNGNSNTQFVTTNGWKDSDWHHLVLVIDDSGSPTATLYVDNVVQFGPSGCQAQNAALFASRLGLGTRWSGGAPENNLPNGSRQAGAAIYNYALTPAQVAQHYRASPPAFRNIAESRAKRLGAILHLPLDDKGGTVAKATIGSDGTYSGSPTLGVAGPSDYLPAGVGFDGVNDYAALTIPTLGSLQAQSVEFWASAASTINDADNRLITLDQAGTTYQWIVWSFVGASLRVLSANGEYSEWTGASIATGWHHHALTYSGTRNGWLWYVDGALVGSPSSATGGGAQGLDGGAYRLMELNGTAHDAPGLAAFSVYARRLSAAEVRANYLLGLNPRGAGAYSPVGY